MSQLEVDKIIPQSGTTLTIGDSGDTITVASGATLTGDLNADNLTSGTVPDARITGAYTGITNLTMSGDLTVDTNTLYVDSANNNVGIVTSNPQTALQVTRDWVSSYGSINVSHSTNSLGGIGLRCNDVYKGGLIYRGGSSGANWELTANDAEPVLFKTTNTERMRIDSSGNLLVGKTSTASGTAGVGLFASGLGQFVRDNSRPVLINRLTSDGDIIELRKDGTAVGFIGTKSSKPYFGSTGSGATSITFGSDKLILSNQDGVIQDNSRDIGSSSERIKDLYLGGGLYVGGTGTANKLDDYEEGTWTPTVNSGVTSPTYLIQEGGYTKIGRLVTFNFDIRVTGGTLTTTDFILQGLPFNVTNDSSVKDSGAFYLYTTDVTTETGKNLPTISTSGNNNILNFYGVDGVRWFGTDMQNNTFIIIASGFYYTD